jgi:hypothetical protein
MPTPSIKSIKSWSAFFFLPIIANKVLPHVEPELHQSFTIAAEAATSVGGSDGSNVARDLLTYIVTHDTGKCCIHNK